MKIDEFIKNHPDREIQRYKHSRKNGIVYFICSGNGNIIYIGTTFSLDCRMQQHNCRIEFSKKPVYFFEAPKLKCLEIERALIAEIKPIYNVSGTGQEQKHRNLVQKIYKARNKSTIPMYPPA